MTRVARFGMAVTIYNRSAIGPGCCRSCEYPATGPRKRRCRTVVMGQSSRLRHGCSRPWARPPRSQCKSRPRRDAAGQLSAMSPMHDPATAFHAFVLVGISAMPLVSQARAPTRWAGHVGIQRVVFHVGHPSDCARTRPGAGKVRDTINLPRARQPRRGCADPQGYAKRILPRITGRKDLFLPEPSLD